MYFTYCVAIKTAIKFSSELDRTFSVDMANRDSSYTLDSMLEKEQETLCSTTEDEDGTVQSGKDEVVEEWPVLEPHVLHLQKFLGEQLAQQFLDSSYEVTVKSGQPLLVRKPGQSAKDYWRLLREHSEAQLQKMTISQSTLKCSLFAKIPTSKFLDQIQDFRRTLEIMYRASKINQNKAVLIMSNNPLTDFIEWQENESPMQYFCKEVIQNQCSDKKDINAFRVQLTEAGKKSYRFVTEDTCKKLKGEFSNRCRIRKSQVLEGTDYPSRCIQLPSKDESEAGSSITEPTTTAHSWESLTYTALMDSRPSITVPGRGNFRHGQPTKWIVNSTNYANNID
ncbi:testis-specific gene 13 protein isoform X2 [Phyllobates terribilis]|uniref:testis-specific gene 13 protein isoform X2 n=1 Tax=Phyllobates terribilis TaxID=111132 RepID=UPI003CCB3C5A